MYEIGKSFHFSAAHTIPGHPKCGRMHGHNYEVTVIVKSYLLNTKGMVIDYGDISKEVKPILEEMDHKYLAPFNDRPSVPMAVSSVYQLPMTTSTAESIAEYIHDVLREVMANYLQLEVKVCETPNTYAIYSSDESENTVSPGSLQDD